MLPALLVISALLAAQLQAAPQLPPGIHPAVCPNYPFCGPAPAGAPPAPSAVSCSGELVSSYPQHFSIRFYEMVCRRWRRTRRPRRRCARSRQPGRDWSGPPVTSGPRARWGLPETSDPQDSADLPDALLSDIFRDKKYIFCVEINLTRAVVYVIAIYLFKLYSFICLLGITNLNTWVCLSVCLFVCLSLNFKSFLPKVSMLWLPSSKNNE